MLEKTWVKPAVEAALGVITAVVVGAILNLILFLGKSAVFTTEMPSIKDVNILSVIWIGNALVLLKKFKMNVLYLIGLSALFGLLSCGHSFFNSLIPAENC